MGFAVNASTMGMAVAGLVVGFLSPHIDRRLGILLSLVLLAVPTTLLAVAPDLTLFTILRVAQGLCMASVFALTLAYLGEQCSSMDAGGAFAAYITGDVASNLRPALSARRRPKTAAWQAELILPAISSVASSAAPCSANCSTGSDGPLALPASLHRWRWRRSSPRAWCLLRRPPRLRHNQPDDREPQGGDACKTEEGDAAVKLVADIAG